MKSMSLARKLMVLVVAFAIATPIAICALAYVFYDNGKALHNITAAGDHQTDALFALIRSVGRVQSTVQNLLREKDPDVIEKLINEDKVESKAAREAIRNAEGSGGEIAVAFETLERANEKCIGGLLKGDFGQAQETLIEEANPAFDRLFTAIGKTKDATSQRAGAAIAAAEVASSRAQVGIFILVGLVIAGLIAFAVIQVRRMVAVLGQSVQELRQASDGTASAASQISRSSQILAQGSSEQAATLEETSAASDEISSTTLKNAENSQLASMKMNDAAQQIADANTRLANMVASMSGIKDSSDKIAKIIKVIDEIAFQTNILALNAAVEAARAGEAGMGFAVVADEVRNLSQRCAQAAQDTASLIEDSISRTRDGKIKLDQVAETFRSITGTAQDVKALVDEVQIASDEQAKGIQQVSKALSQIQQVTQASAAGAEEGAAAGEELSSQAVIMKVAVVRLSALVNGASKDTPQIEQFDVV